jgi:hypothetical protein
MALRAPKQKTKQQKKLISDARRRERDLSAKRKNALLDKDREGAKATAQAAKAARDPETIKKMVQERYSTSLINELRKRLASAVTVDSALRAYNPPIDLSVTTLHHETGVEAYTDFRSITLKIDEQRMPSPYGAPDALKEFMFAVKGMFHHEGGHIIHTWPLWDMWREADQVFLDRAKAEGVTQYATLQATWNAVEDQRMESARVRDFPAIQSYFEHMMGGFLLKERSDKFWEYSAWALLAGREYLPAAVRGVAKSQFTADAEEWLRLVREYKAAKTRGELLDALLDCYLFNRKNGQQMPEGIDMHAIEGMATNGDQKALSAATKPGDGSEGSQTAVGKGKGAEGGEGAEGGSESGSEGDGDNAPEDDPTSITAGRGEGDAHFTEKQLTDAIHKMMSNPLSTADKDTLQKAMADATAPGLRSYDGQTQSMNAVEIGKAVALQNDLVRALETYVTRATPHWVHRTEDGVLDACAYRSREAGETDYNIGMAGEQGEVLDLHVSVLADVSYSMSSHMRQLSVSMLGMKYACDELNIPNNFTIWSDGAQNFRIYEDGPEEVIFPALGGTDPTVALDDAVVQNEEQRPNHLFLVFTDGAWYGVDSVGKWKNSDEQQFIIVKWGGGPRHIHGADAVVDLPSLDRFPDLLRDALDNMLDSIV